MGTEVNINVLQEGDLYRANLVSYQILAHSPMEEEEMIFKILVIALLVLITFNTAVMMLLFFGWLESQKGTKK